jgi:hypothetical protein
MIKISKTTKKGRVVEVLEVRPEQDDKATRRAARSIEGASGHTYTESSSGILVCIKL